MSATRRLGAFAARTAATELAPEIAAKTAICLLDALGLAILAKDEPTAAAAREASADATGLAGSAAIWADGRRAVLSEAVLANGIAVHAHFQDDTEHDSWSHPGSLVPPVALSLGDALSLPLSTVLRSTAAGYATMKWLGAGEAVSRGLIGRGLRTSPSFGTIGAAAAAAVCLGLDEDRAAQAVAIAASTTGGTLEPVRSGSDEWRVQNGRAAQGGFVAAQLAARGVRGAPEALEGPKGFLRSLAGLEAVPPAWASDPDTAMMVEVMAKPFATLGDNMSAVVAARLLHRDGVDHRAVRAMRVTIWRPYTEYPGTSFKGPFERLVQTQASTAFAAAAMLVHGRLDYEMGERHRDDPAILLLVAKTEVLPDDVGTHLDATVEVELADGHILRRTASESTETLVFQDDGRAIAVFEERLAASGRPAGLGTEAATALLAAAREGREVSIRDMIDSLGDKGERS